MSDQIELTLDGGPAGEKAPVREPSAMIVSSEDITLSAEEQQQVSAFAEKIDLRDNGQILNYGTSAQKKLDSFSGEALSGIRTKDSGEAGKMLAGLVVELKGFKFDEDLKGIGGFFKKLGGGFARLRAKYDTVDKNVQNIASVLEKHKLRINSDVIGLDRMFAANLDYLKELTMYIMAGKERLQTAEQTELPALRQKAEASGQLVDAQAANDFADQLNRFDKRLHDLQLTRAIAIQMGPQIRMVQKSDSDLSDKIQSTLNNTIPLWRNQMYLAIAMNDTKEAVEAQASATDFTNEMLKRNAEALHQNAVEVAQASERGIVDIDTLVQTNNKLISTLDEVLTIQSSGREKRRAAEAELTRIEGDLRNKLLEMKN